MIEGKDDWLYFGDEIRFLANPYLGHTTAFCNGRVLRLETSGDHSDLDGVGHRLIHDDAEIDLHLIAFGGFADDRARLVHLVQAEAARELVGAPPAVRTAPAKAGNAAWLHPPRLPEQIFMKRWQNS